MESLPTPLTFLFYLTLVPQPLMCVTLGLDCLVEAEKETVVDLIDWESGVELRQLVNVSSLIYIKKIDDNNYLGGLYLRIYNDNYFAIKCNR